jgi:hypothetical protein
MSTDCPIYLQLCVGLLDTITAQAAPALREAFGIGVDVAAEMIILAGDNPERIKSAYPSLATTTGRTGRRQRGRSGAYGSPARSHGRAPGLWRHLRR